MCRIGALKQTFRIQLHVLPHAFMLTTTVTSNSALAGVNEMKAVDQHPITQAAITDLPAHIANLQNRLRHVDLWSGRRRYMYLGLHPAKPCPHIARWCGICGGDILDNDNDNVHANCRTILRDAMLEAEAKCFPQDAVTKRGQKRESEADHDLRTSGPPKKMYKLKVVPPPLPPPYDEPDSDSETDPDMPALEDCGPPTPPAQRRTAQTDWAVRLGDMSDDDDIEMADIINYSGRLGE